MVFFNHKFPRSTNMKKVAKAVVLAAAMAASFSALAFAPNQSLDQIQREMASRHSQGATPFVAAAEAGAAGISASTVVQTMSGSGYGTTEIVASISAAPTLVGQLRSAVLAASGFSGQSAYNLITAAMKVSGADVPALAALLAEFQPTAAGDGGGFGGGNGFRGGSFGGSPFSSAGSGGGGGRASGS
jgi:hypothetical protein